MTHHPHLPGVVGVPGMWCCRRNQILLADTGKNYRSVNQLACKQSSLVLCSHGREWALPKWGAGAGGKSRGSKSKGGQKPGFSR